MTYETGALDAGFLLKKSLFKKALTVYYYKWYTNTRKGDLTIN